MKIVVAAVTSMIILCSSMQADAAYSDALSWNPMKMLLVTFTAATNTLKVVTAPAPPSITVPVLKTDTDANGNGTTPDPVTYASFDPTQPWSVLNGKVFSRQLGWDNSRGILNNIRNDPDFGADANLWIEVVDQSPGLETYLAIGLYGVNGNDTQTVDPAVNGYTPIFGTAGSSPRWSWDGSMVHNAYAVPLNLLTSPNQPFYATYKLYIGDSTGNIIPGSPEITTTWHWTGPATFPVVNPSVNGACGGSSGGSFSTAPTIGLCSAGNASAVSGSGPWDWSCAGLNGGTTAACSANLATIPVNGTCGSSNAGTFSSAPTTNLCNSGNASAVSGSGPWNWSCAGVNGGTAATCSGGIASEGVQGLINRGNGMYYDPHLNVTWYNATSAGQLFVESDYDPITGQPRKFPLKEYLRSLSVNGITGWRLPTMPRIDLVKDPYVTDAGELGHLFNSELKGAPRAGLPNPYTGLMSGLKRVLYWTGTVAQDNGMVSYYILDFDTGKWSIDCGMEGMSFGNYLLAVHDGDVVGSSANAGPRLLITAPYDGLVTRETTVAVSGTVSDKDGVASLIVNGEVVVTGVDGSFSYSLKLADGVNTITTIAIDTAGHKTIDTRTVTAGYSTAPLWNPMTMLDVSFDATVRKLSVQSLESVLTQYGVGYPVLNVAVDGTYDPTKPWGVLNGTSFSRQLGWNDAFEGAQDGSAILDKIRSVYGTDAGIWIKSLSQTSGLQTYLAIGLYGVNADNSQTVDPAAHVYSPIFGTADNSTAWRWDGKMDHNSYAVPLASLTKPNQMFSATYRIYVGDSQGKEILNLDGSSASTTTTWTWQGPAEVQSSGTSLVDRGNGLFYDTEQNLTWYLSEADSSIKHHWTAPVNGIPTAQEYVRNLSVNGVTGWRLPTGKPSSNSNTYASAGELGNLFYRGLGGAARTGLSTPYTGPYQGLLKRALYWSGTLVSTAGGMNSYAILDFDTGKWAMDCGMPTMSFGNYVVAVHEGDVAAPDNPQTGDVNGDGVVDIKDALQSLQIAIGNVTPTKSQISRGDVAPFISGKPQPDGVIDSGDSLVILRKVVGLITW